MPKERNLLCGKKVQNQRMLIHRASPRPAGRNTLTQDLEGQGQRIEFAVIGKVGPANEIGNKLSKVKNKLDLNNKSFSERHDYFVRSGNHKEALALLKKELRFAEKDPWLLANIAMTYYDLNKYRIGMSYALKAYEISPKDPLIMHYYSILLNANGYRIKARDIWQLIAHMPINRLAFGPFGEGLRYARSLQADVYARIGFSYMADNDPINGAKFLKRHLSLRRSGQPSTFDRRYVKQQLKRCMTYGYG